MLQQTAPTSTKKIEHYAQKSRFTQLLHDWIFTSTGHTPSYHKHILSPNYSAYSNKIIRHIVIDTKDPFGYDIIDTTQHPNRWWEKAGNAIHIKSQKMAVSKFVLFKENQPLDTLLIQETARLLRAQDYIHRVRIIPKPIAGSPDSLDLVIRVIDSWSMLPRVSISQSHYRLGLAERNFLGTGHRFDISFLKRLSDGNTGFEAYYTIPNFKNTFINFTGKYAVDYDHYYDRYISINRNFYSPLTRWAGGAFLQDRSLERPFLNDTLGYTPQDIQFLYQDYWIGRAFHIFKGDSKMARTTNLTLSLRASFMNYKETPTLEFDSTRYFSDEQFYLARVGLSTRQYVQDRYIFRDGVIEDVPIGALFSIISGFQHKHNNDRFYLGLHTAYADYFKWGFWGVDFKIGSFFNPHAQQTTLNFKTTYFSPLLKLGHGWKMRQFIKPQVVMGLNRLESPFDRLTLRADPFYRGIHSYDYVDYENKHQYIDYRTGSIQGFDSPVKGTQKFVLDLQTQLYSPWQFFGFRLNPFFHLSLAYLTGNTTYSYGSNSLYSGITLGLIIRNDYLVFDTFQLSFSFFPSMPPGRYNVFSTNSFRSEDFGFQGFQLGEPHPVIFE